MKTRLVLVFTLLGVAFFGLLGAKTKKNTYAPPELKLDATPVASGPAPAVTSYADSLEAIRPAVVSVYSTKIVREQVPEIFNRLFEGRIQGREQRLDGLGSGVIVSADGFILTNNHVVEGADELKVLLSDGRELLAEVIGSDPKTDIAVIKIDAAKLPAATLADSDALRVGDIVFAIGNPLGVGQTVTMGIVSATGRNNVNLLTDRDPEAYEDFIQTDAAINFGNSGGALVDARGRLVGINSGIATNNRGNIGIGFAVPVNLARSVMASLIEHGTVVRGFIGVNAQTLTAELAAELDLPKDTKGVLLDNVAPEDGPAAKAGLQRGDIVTHINNRPVNSWEDLRITIAQIAPGTTVPVRYLRDGKPSKVEVTLGKRDEIASADFLPGLTVEPLTDQFRRENRIREKFDGLLITEVDPESPYAGVFPKGVVILELNREAVTDTASARRLLRDGRNLAMVYYRGSFRHVIFTVE